MAVLAAAQAFAHWPQMFDDAFITYRYAANLADGLGLVWNPGQPTEGYTNFLLVLLLVPVELAGLDPLLVTRILSGAALFLLVVLLHRRAVALGFAPGSALMAAIPVILVARGIRVSTLGLETTLYTAALFTAFVFYLRYVEERQRRALRLSYVVQLAAFLLRPEALLLSAVITGHLAWTHLGPGHLPERGAASDGTGEGPAPDAGRAGWSWLAAPVLFLGVPVAAYLLWKLAYFGHLLPNSFHLKVFGDSGLGLSPSGLGAVMAYGLENKFLLGVAFVAILARGDRHRRYALLALAFAAAYAAFYAFVDPLMNPGNRFLYPVTPFLYLAALPALAAAADYLRTLPSPGPARVVAALMGVYFLAPTLVPDVEAAVRIAVHGREIDEREIVHRRDAVGRALAEWEGIEDMTLAVPDVGVVGYRTPSPIVDLVGLNDRFIATTTDVGELTGYLFSRDITVFFYPTMRNLDLIDWGHGNLGRMSEWVHHPNCRWDEFAYVGTVTFSNAAHEYHLLLRRSYPRFDAFRSFLLRRVVDTVRDDLRLPDADDPA